VPEVSIGHEIGRQLDDGRLKHRPEQRQQKEIAHPAASVLIFGFDDYPGLCKRFNQRIANKVVEKFFGLLRSKVRVQESLLPLADGRIGIALDNVDREQCAVFARRVCKALATATLSVGGQQVKATVSAGIAAIPRDGEGLSAEGLFYLALSRLDAAVAAGGNRIIDADSEGRNLRQGEFIARLASLLTASAQEAEMPCKNWLRSICVACHDARPEGQPTPCGSTGMPPSGLLG
jgi:GGDEF domain-containing protein